MAPAKAVHHSGVTRFRGCLFALADRGGSQSQRRGGFCCLLVLMCGLFVACRYVSKPAAGGRGAADRQFFFVNRRPVDLPKVSQPSCCRRSLPAKCVHAQLSSSQQCQTVVLIQHGALKGAAALPAPAHLCVPSQYPPHILNDMSTSHCQQCTSCHYQMVPSLWLGEWLVAAGRSSVSLAATTAALQSPAPPACPPMNKIAGQALMSS